MLKLLIVDDDPEMVETIRDFFTPQLGWNTVGATSGTEAIEILQQDPSFDAAVLDLFMPGGMSGEEVLCEIRKRPELSHLSVTVLTGQGGIESAVKCLRYGAYQYLEKASLDLNDLRPILISGVALQRAYALPKALLATPDLKAALKAFHNLMRETINPEGLIISFLKTDSTVICLEPEGTDMAMTEQREFVMQVLESRRPLYRSDLTSLTHLGSLNPEAKTLLAAPVPTIGAGITGVLAVESTQDNAIDRNFMEVLAYLSNLLAMALELWAKQRQLVEDERQRWRDLPIVVNELRHYISTPVQVIEMQATELIQNHLTETGSAKIPKQLREKIAERVRIIQKNADAIKNICFYLTNVAEEIRMHKRRFNLIPELRECISEIKSELDSKRIRLRVEGASDTGLVIKADQHLIKYCLQCLLRNSIEAIEERRMRDVAGNDKCHDEISIEINNMTSGAVQVNIKDTGIGIDPEHQSHIFKPLFSTKQKQEPGGLGLFGVRRIVNLHDGTVNFTSQPGFGTIFTISLPSS